MPPKSFRPQASDTAATAPGQARRESIRKEPRDPAAQPADVRLNVRDEKERKVEERRRKEQAANPTSTRPKMKTEIVKPSRSQTSQAETNSANTATPTSKAVEIEIDVESVDYGLQKMYVNAAIAGWAQAETLRARWSGLQLCEYESNPKLQRPVDTSALGKIVLVELSDDIAHSNPIVQSRVKNLKSSGAAGAIFYREMGDELQMSWGGTSETPLALAVHCGQLNGEILISHLRRARTCTIRRIGNCAEANDPGPRMQDEEILAGAQLLTEKEKLFGESQGGWPSIDYNDPAAHGADQTEVQVLRGAMMNTQHKEKRREEREQNGVNGVTVRNSVEHIDVPVYKSIRHPKCCCTIM